MSETQNTVIDLAFYADRGRVEEANLPNKECLQDVARIAAKCAKTMCRQTSDAMFFSPWRQKSRYL